MAVGKQAGRNPNERTSHDSLAYDPISILLEMSQGLDANHTAKRATKSRPELGHSQQSAQLIPQRRSGDGK
jgi:hypothetical protein